MCVCVRICVSGCKVSHFKWLTTISYLGTLHMGPLVPFWHLSILPDRPHRFESEPIFLCIICGARKSHYATWEWRDQVVYNTPDVSELFINFVSCLNVFTLFMVHKLIGEGRGTGGTLPFNYSMFTKNKK